MTRPRLLDLFCGAGGAAMGYHRAGWDVTGIDHRPQPRYPFTFIQGDALRPPVDLRYYDAIHASPPCQAYSVTRHIPGGRSDHPDLVAQTRAVLRASGRPYVIENVQGAPLERGSVMLCGLMFELRVLRHRWFESSLLLLVPSHPSHRGERIGQRGMVCVQGHGECGGGVYADGRRRRYIPADHRTMAAWSAGMGIQWMTRRELAQAIPPAYTEHIGRQLLAAL
jgi:DNA (cytosine-5)-methyltransferase 1